MLSQLPSHRNAVDMLHGPLLGKILMFALPFALSGVMEQLFNSVDVMVVGRFASSEAMAAVGANTFLINLCINLFVGMSVGANVILSNHIGQHDNRHTSCRQHHCSTVGGQRLLPSSAWNGNLAACPRSHGNACQRHRRCCDIP